MIDVLTLATAVGAGMVGGVLHGFSSFVMPALDRLPPARALAAMQAINRRAPASRSFMGVLMGTAVTSLVVGVAALVDPGDAGAGQRLAGSLSYLVVIAVTGAYHVPRNDALGTVDPAEVGAADRWHRYAPGWTAWNHVRAAAAVSSAVVLTVGYAAG